jgi:hypothetical protein
VQIVFVAARFYTRYMQRMKCELDDYIMLLALVRSFPCDVILGGIGANIFSIQAGSLAKAILFIVCKHTRVNSTGKYKLMNPQWLNSQDWGIISINLANQKRK